MSAVSTVSAVPVMPAVTAVSTISAVSVASAVSVTVTVVAVAIISVAVPAMIPTPSIPGTDTEKDAAAKPLRTVITVGSAVVGVVVVIAPITDWRPINRRHRNNCRSNTDAYRNLGLGISRER
jgi:hypothetical protein